jgi:hypothetical protein
VERRVSAAPPFRVQSNTFFSGRKVPPRFRKIKMKPLLSARSLLFSGVCLACVMPAFAQDTAPETEDAPVEAEARQQTVVVRGLFIPDEKRNTSEVSSLIDEGDFSLQGDGDAAAALARVAGSPLPKTNSSMFAA